MAELTEVVADAAETVGEEAMDVADAARGMDPQAVRMLLTGLGIGLVGGGAIGYAVANKRLRTKYEQIAEEEIDEMREHFRKRAIAKEEKPDLSAKAAEIAEREGYSKPATPVLQEVEDEGVPAEEEEVYEDPVLVAETEEVVETAETVENVFDKDDPQPGGWDYEAEVARRRPEFPYVIHEDERYEKEGYTHTDLTYYEGDDVLADGDDKPVDDIDKIIGRANLDRFGDGTEDKDVMFIRNDTLTLVIEVNREKRSYSEVVHGIKHSDEPRRRRVRFDDDDSP